MEQEHVDVFGSKRLQAGLDAFLQNLERELVGTELAGGAFSQKRACAGRHCNNPACNGFCGLLPSWLGCGNDAELGYDNCLIAFAAKEFTEERLGLTIAVGARDVEETDAFVPRRG